MGPGTVRALKVAVVAMGVVIIVATGVLVAVIVQRLGQARLAGGSVPARPAPVSIPEPAVPAGVVLDEPAGTHIVAAGGYGEWLAVTLAGGGPDRVVLLDRALRVVGRIRLAR